MARISGVVMILFWGGYTIIIYNMAGKNTIYTKWYNVFTKQTHSVKKKVREDLSLSLPPP